MHRVTLVRGARQLLTLHGPTEPRRGADLKNLGLIPDGAVLIVDGIIKEVGPSRRVENLALARHATEIDASGRVVMPGFVDSDVHLVGGAPRMPETASGDQVAGTMGADLLALGRAIQDVSPRTLGAQALGVIKEAVRHGTTTLEAKSGFGLSESDEIKILRVNQALDGQPVAVVSTFVWTLRTSQQERLEQSLDRICSRLLPMIKRRKLAEFAEIRSTEGTADLMQVRRYLDAARELGLGLKVRTGEGSSPGMLRLAVELGAATVDVGPEDQSESLALLARSNTVAMMQPGPGFYLGTERYAPARELIDRGVAVALASNYNPETSPSQSMQMMLTLACRRMNMTPAEAITAATLNGAHGLRRASQIGSLEKGKKADLIILGVPDYREIPYHFGINLVDLVMINGKMLLERAEVKWPVS